MMEITVDLSGAVSRLRSMQKQIPFAASLAINKTAQAVKDDLIKEMKIVFENPTPYTLNSIYIKPSDKKNLSAEIGLKYDTFKGIPASKYLAPQIHGGGRHQKRFERALVFAGVMPQGYLAVPGNAAQLDRYGNIPRSLIIELLSYFQAFAEMGYKANMSAEKREAIRTGGGGKRGYVYIVKGVNDDSGQPGIYKRFEGSRDLLCMIKFIPYATYQSRFDFFGVANNTVNRVWKNEMEAAVNYAVKTAK